MTRAFCCTAYVKFKRTFRNVCYAVAIGGIADIGRPGRETGR
jgi:hypothetical protein